MSSNLSKQNSVDNKNISDIIVRKKNRPPGDVRIRSNVCVNPDAWHLVPGDLAKHYRQFVRNFTKKQHDEMMYYVPCCLCNRTILQINDEGCDREGCLEQGIPSCAEAKRRKGCCKE